MIEEGKKKAKERNRGNTNGIPSCSEQEKHFFKSLYVQIGIYICVDKFERVPGSSKTLLYSFLPLKTGQQEWYNREREREKG